MRRRLSPSCPISYEIGIPPPPEKKSLVSLSMLTSTPPVVLSHNQSDSGRQRRGKWQCIALQWLQPPQHGIWGCQHWCLQTLHIEASITHRIYNQNRLIHEHCAYTAAYAVHAVRTRNVHDTQRTTTGGQVGWGRQQ